MDSKFRPYRTGMLTVKEKYVCGRGVETNKRCHVYYLCQCDCGKEVVFSGEEIAKHPYSCGCTPKPEISQRLGISASAVYKWESGMTSIRENNLKAICETYNVSEDWMKGLDMPKVPETDDHVKTRMLLNHAMMFLTEKDLLKAELFISDILEQPLHIGIMKPSDTEALA